VSATENDYTANFSNLALYLKPQYGITDSISIYGLVGYGQTKFAPTYLMDVKTSCNTFQYGIGTKYSFANGVSFFVDYTVMANDKEIHRIQDIASLTRYDKLSMDLSATTFGVSYSF
jgi:opacity protein-like surface antigen